MYAVSVCHIALYMYAYVYTCGLLICTYAYSAIKVLLQKWQKDELWDFCTFALMWQVAKGILWDFCTFAIMWQKWQKDELWDFCHFCHHVAKVAKG